MPLRAATWTFFIYWCLPRFNATTGFSTVLLLQFSLIIFSQIEKEHLGRNLKTVVTVGTGVLCFLCFGSVIAVHMHFSWNNTQDLKIPAIGLITVASFILFITVLQDLETCCYHKNDISPESIENGSKSKQELGDKFFLIVSIIQVIFMFCSVFGAFAVFCEPPHDLFGMMKCQFKDYDIYFTKDGDVTEALVSAILCIVLSFVCFKMCYFACAINVQFSCCFVPLLLSTFMTVIAMAYVSISQCSLFGYIILPYRFNEEKEMIVQLSITILAVILVLCILLVFLWNHRNFQAKRMENQER